MITSRITGTDSDGFTHTANIVSRGDERYVECEGCDYQRRVSWSAREAAESHLWNAHNASGFHQRLTVGPFVAVGLTLLVMFFLMAKLH
ncbi:hypothetical protein ACFVXG_14050 [Kitasatospora sp. NPDC058162]|uniref:hypothetical protein n=1 Tax=Kitasatospora sp. NPDC058162 TaxID=3346362 RepID=UPI0036D8FCCC